MANATLSTYDDITENECVAQDCFKVIRARVSFSMLLKLANVPYRYRMFSFYGENKKARLEISPRPGQMPPPLPKWLQIPYLVPVKGYSLQIVYDSCVNPIIRSGDGLYDQTERIPDTSSQMAMTSYLSRTDNSIRSSH